MKSTVTKKNVHVGLNEEKSKTDFGMWNLFQRDLYHSGCGAEQKIKKQTKKSSMSLTTANSAKFDQFLYAIINTDTDSHVRWVQHHRNKKWNQCNSIKFGPFIYSDRQLFCDKIWPATVIVVKVWANKTNIGDLSIDYREWIFFYLFEYYFPHTGKTDLKKRIFL